MRMHQQTNHDTTNLLATLNGRDLTALARSGYLCGLEKRSLAPDPTAAIERIVSTFGARPTRLGTNVPGIAAIREAIWACTRDAVVANGLVITAPHTHWNSDLPIVISASDHGYRIGPATPSSEGSYTPVSIVFSRQGPLPYEWADDSIAFEKDDLERIWSAIHDVCMTLADYEWPLGLSLSFRFKELLSAEPVPTLEFQEDDKMGGMALIVRVKDAIKSHEESAFEQVAWHSYSDSAYSLAPEERELLANIRQRLDGIERVTDLQSIAQQLARELPHLIKSVG